MPLEQDSPEATLLRMVFDAAWYASRNPDVIAANLEPWQHFVRFGLAEARSPNGFFDSAWYTQQHPEATKDGFHPLLHYMLVGAATLHNPHPRFDALYYVDQHPEAAANPLLFHLRFGRARGYPTEKPVDIRDYLQSTLPPPPPPRRFFDVIIVVSGDLDAVRQCIEPIIAGRHLPLARIIAVDDATKEPELAAWLERLAAGGHIHLIRNRRKLGFAACANLGIDAAETHDVLVLRGDAMVSAASLHAMAAHAWSQPQVATVSPLHNGAGAGDGGGMLPMLGQLGTAVDAVCREVNSGRSVQVPAASGSCLYIRRDAIHTLGRFEHTANAVIGFCLRASQAGWQHRLACDAFCVEGTSAGVSEPAGGLEYGSLLKRFKALGIADPFRFAAVAALLKRSGLPVILMVSHNLGGGVRQHIRALAERYNGRAHVLLMERGERGLCVSVLQEPRPVVLQLPADRIEDLACVLTSAGVSRVHVHHQLRLDVDIRNLIHRLGVPFDVTVHDYYAICPQVNLLPSPEDYHCGQPGPAECNRCLAEWNANAASDITAWRLARVWQFVEADRVICPSRDVRNRLARHGLADRAIVAPHESPSGRCWPMIVPPYDGGPLRIVLLGVMANHKGTRIVASVVEAAAPRALSIQVIGDVEASFPEPTRKLIRSTGPYREDELDDLLRKARPHVIWFASTAPETYSYTLTTAIAAGLPIVATRLGSFPERLEGRPNTWLLDATAPTGAWLAVFEEVRRTLATARTPPKVARIKAEPDFYQNMYLTPAIRNADGAAKPRIMVVPERLPNGAPSPCAYIRLLLPLDHPGVRAQFDVVLADPDTALEYRADIIATQRHAITDAAMAERLAAHARQTGAKLVYDLDDDLLSVPADHPGAAMLQSKAEAVNRMARLADVLWVSTLGLAERLAVIRPDAIVVANRLDERIWTASPLPAPYWDDPVRILCMGTSTHDRDFALIEPALADIKATYGDQVTIDIIGMTPPRTLPPGLNRIGPSTQGARSYPAFVDWITRVRPRWHIGLAPLLDTPFNRSKSSIKALDYAALGLATLASDVKVYRGSLADGVGGQLVANDPNAWRAAIEWLVRDQARRRRVAAQGREAFLAEGTLAGQAEERLRLCNTLLQRECVLA